MPEVNDTEALASADDVPKVAADPETSGDR
jgi:hypothetical protein